MFSDFFTHKRYFLYRLVLLIFLLSPMFMNTYAQEDFKRFRLTGTRTNTTGMIVLGSWALANIATGAYGWSKNTGDNMYFHQMNFFWNTVNLSIASIALYNLYTTDFSLMGQEEFLTRQIKTEKILLINSVLDLGYIGTGFLLKHLSKNPDNRQALLKGYGNSLLMQGGFLLVFDLVLYGIFRIQRLEYLHSVGFIPSADGLNFFATVGFN